jgi:hypothetical protein
LSQQDTIRQLLPPGYVSVYEFARQARLTIGTVYSHLYSGKFGGSAKFGGKWGIPIARLREVLQVQGRMAEVEKIQQLEAKQHAAASEGD